MLSNIRKSFYDTYNAQRIENLSEGAFLFWCTCIFIRCSWNIQIEILQGLKTFLVNNNFMKKRMLLQEEFQPIVSKLSAELSDWRGRKLGSILAHYYIQSSLLFKWITKWLNKQPYSSSVQVVISFSFQTSRGKSLLESWGTTFLADWQPPLILVSFTSKSHEGYPY